MFFYLIQRLNKNTAIYKSHYASSVIPLHLNCFFAFKIRFSKVDTIRIFASKKLRDEESSKTISKAGYSVENLLEVLEVTQHFSDILVVKLLFIELAALHLRSVLPI
jgi:hypothetical protein